MSSLFTWQMAELLAQSHMRFIGYADAALTQAGADGGLDVVSSEAAAQVKFYANPVGIAEVQRLQGAAGSRTPLFYASSGYTSAARDWSTTNGVALFGYTTASLVDAENEPARSLALGDEAVASTLRLIGEARELSKRGTQMNTDLQDLLRSQLAWVRSDAFGQLPEAEKVSHLERFNAAIASMNSSGIDQLSARMNRANAKMEEASQLFGRGLRADGIAATQESFDEMQSVWKDFAEAIPSALYELAEEQKRHSR